MVKIAKTAKTWTVGRGIAVGLKWIAIMGVVITIFAFLQFYMKFQAGYYEKEFCDCPVPRPSDIQTDDELDDELVGSSCGTVSPDGRSICCARKYGKGYYWDDQFGGCV